MTNEQNVPFATIDNARNLGALLGAASLAMSKDATRPHLTGMLLESLEGRLRMVCTDGHRLHRLDVPCSNNVPGLHVGASGILIPAAAVKALIKALKAAPKANPGVELRVVGNALHVTLTDSTSTYQLDAESRFPPYDRVIPGYADTPPLESRSRIGMNCQYVAEAAKACGVVHKLDGSQANMAMTSAGELDPLVFRADCPSIADLTCIVMPARI